MTPAPGGPADESVFVRGLPPGRHESLLYVWTSDADQKDPDFLSVLDTDGNCLEAHPAPDYMYDVGVKPELNLIVTSSWAHPHAVKAGNTPMDQVGDEVVAWDWKTAKVLQVEHLDKSPLEVRWLHGAAARGGFINCAFGNSVWHWQVGPDGKLAFHRVIKLPDGSLPADMRISYDNKFLFVSLFGGGAVQQYDVADPNSDTNRNLLSY